MRREILVILVLIVEFLSVGRGLGGGVPILDAFLCGCPRFVLWSLGIATHSAHLSVSILVTNKFYKSNLDLAIEPKKMLLLQVLNLNSNSEKCFLAKS